MKVIGYVRVSTEKQAEKGLSLEAQRAKVQAYCTLYEYDLVEIVEDAGASAKSMDRPGLQAVLGRLHAGEASGIVVAKLDRLTRRVSDLCQLVETFQAQRWALLSVGEAIDTSSAAGRMVVNLLGVISQWERETIGERTRDALAVLKATGKRLGRPAIGDRAMDMGAVADILRRHEDGQTIRSIAADLQAAGVLTPSGGQWHATTVARVIKRFKERR